MAKEVFLTQLAVDNYENIIEYLIDKWGVTSANNFIDRFSEIRILLSESPELFSFEDKIKQVRKCVITKHNTLYFKETVDSIRILTIFDTRQNPDKLNSVF
jgi:plasmid stabilization system protein ParE